MRVSCVLYWYYSTTVFDLLPSLLPAMICVKQIRMPFSGRDFIRKWSPFFQVEADLKTISKNGSLENRQSRVYKKGEPVWRPENVHFRTQKRCFKGWPKHKNKLLLLSAKHVRRQLFRRLTAVDRPPQPCREPCTAQKATKKR